MSVHNPVPDEAEALFDQAFEMLPDTGNASPRVSRDIIALLSLAIQRANQVFPEAQAMKAKMHYNLEEYSLAWEEANNAIRHDNNNFRAQMVKVFIAMDGIQVTQKKGGILGFLWMTLKTTFTAKTVREGWSSGKSWGEETTEAAISQGRAKSEIRKLLSIFDNLCGPGQDAGECLLLMGVLKNVADVLVEGCLLPEISKEIYSHIAYASIQSLSDATQDERREIEQLRLLAKGRLVSR